MRHRNAESPREAEARPESRPDWLSWEKALAAILERCAPLPGEICPAEEAVGRALAGDVEATLDHPPWDNSAMDGFAVRAEEVSGATESEPVVLPISDDIAAGGFPSGSLRSGTAARVMTGAPVPEGATGVVRLEHTDGGSGDKVRILSDSDSRRNVRRRAEDLSRGEVVLRAGDEVTPAVVGLLAMLGRREVEVIRRPRVGILANGDELVDFDRVEEALSGRKLMNSNTYALASQVRSAGGDPVNLGIARDDPASVRDRLTSVGDLDALISSAGVSVGAHDVVRTTLLELGMEHVFWRVRIRPGSPMTFGVLGPRPVWGLPGNPVSAMVTFEVFLRPAIRRLAGHRRLQRDRVTVRARKAIRSAEDLTHFYRVRLTKAEGGPPLAELTGPQGSGILTSMTLADALAIVPEGVAEVEAGDPLEVIPLWGR